MSERNDEQLRMIAAQLRKPQGDYADEVARKMNEANADLNRYTIEMLDIKAGDFVVEIGMGNGRFVSELLDKDNSLRYAGCDYSPEMVAAAKALNHVYLTERRASFHDVQADKLPFEAGSVDILFTVNTIYFWYQPREVLSEFHRVLRRGGRLVIGLRPKHSMIKYPFTRFGFEMYSAGEVHALLSASGFVVSQVVERKEPTQEIDGDRFNVESLVIVAHKAVDLS